jgi:Putative Ig domain
MRKTLVGLSLGLLLLTVAPAGVAFAKTRPAPAPDKLVCSPTTNGGTLVKGTCVLQRGAVGQPYEGFIITTNNAGGIFSIIAGSLPPGLSMPAEYGASGTIVGGTPTQKGTFAFTVKGVDQEGQPLEQAYSITIGSAPPLTISFPATCCNPGTVGQSYLQNIFVSGGISPYAASVASGQLPPGLGLWASPPISITGMPTRTGTFAFTVKVIDGAGDQATLAGTITVS